MKSRLDLKRLIFHISSLVDLGQEVTSTKGFNEKMKSALYVVTGIFSVPKAALFVYDSNQSRLELLVCKGLKGIEGMDLRINASRVDALSKNEPCNINEMKDISVYEGNNDIFKKLQAKTFVPLFAKSEFVGALALGKRLSNTSYLKSEKNVLKVVANQIAIALHNISLFKKLTSKAAENRRLYENMKHIYHDTIQAFAAAIDAKDVYTKNHSYRVAMYSVAIARELGWEEHEVEAIYVAGLLHDIGKIIIDRGVINKSEGLSVAEIDEIRKHPQISYDILSKIRFPWKNIGYFVRHHHERVDGKGYPDSLRGIDLSDGVKILALADAFDAMTTDRPYRKKLSLPDALTEVKKCLGSQFDDKISNIFFRVLQKELRGEITGTRIITHLDKDFDPLLINTIFE